MIDIRKILSEKKPKVGGVLFIAIDGHGGSGKSTLAALLSKHLNAELLHTDDFAGWDNPLDWWPKVVKQVFLPIQNGATSLSYQPSSWWANHHPEPITEQRVTPVMLLEGVTSSRKEFADFISLRIYVDTPIEVCLERGLARDLSTGKSRTELTALWQGWFAAEAEYFARDNPIAKADIILDGTKAFEEQILL